MYNVFKQLGNGEFVQVASRDKLEEAVQLVNGLNAEWPGEYEVRESHFQAVSYAIKLSIDRDVKAGNRDLDRFLHPWRSDPQTHYGRGGRILVQVCKKLLYFGDFGEGSETK